MDELITVAGESRGIYEEKRSEFICILKHTESPEEAAALVERVKREHYDARHNCWAYLLANGGKRCSDDGEPQGTAGLPILEVLEKSGVTDVTAVVTRYFGGVLLGAGGLVRAYSKAVSAALTAARLCRMVDCTAVSFDCPYSDFSQVKRLLEQKDAELKNVSYSEIVTVEASVPDTALSGLQSALTELSSGRLTLQKTGTEKRPVPVSKTE